MALNINYAGNSYAGEVLEDLLVYTAHGNDTFAEGLIHIKPGVQKKYVLPSITLGSIIQDNNATPVSGKGGKPEGAGSDFNQYTFAERYLEPSDFMVYLEFNPRDFETYWRPFQPEGALIFRDLDPKVQSKMLHLLIDKKDQYIGDSIWCARKPGDAKISAPAGVTGCTEIGGASAAGPMKYFNGALARVLDNLTAAEDSNERASGKVILAGTTTLATGKAVEEALYKMWLATPKNIRKHSDLKFVMGWDAWDLYDQYLTSQQFKYVENSTENVRTFKGKRIVVINGIPEHTIFLGKFNTSMDSNLWMGVDYATDQESIKVERLQANSELYFFQMRMKMDVNIVMPSELVVHTAYTRATA